jgi:hypothetical protein
VVGINDDDNPDPDNPEPDNPDPDNPDPDDPDPDVLIGANGAPIDGGPLPKYMRIYALI